MRTKSAQSQKKEQKVPNWSTRSRAEPRRKPQGTIWIFQQLVKTFPAIPYDAWNYLEREATCFPSASVHLRLGLTRREQQLIPLVAEGLTNNEIASHFCLSEQTVKNHLYRRKQKVGADDRLGIVQMRRTQGFMTWPPRTTLPAARPPPLSCLCGPLCEIFFGLRGLPPLLPAPGQVCRFERSDVSAPRHGFCAMNAFCLPLLSGFSVLRTLYSPY